MKDTAGTHKNGCLKIIAKISASSFVLLKSSSLVVPLLGLTEDQLHIRTQSTLLRPEGAAKCSYLYSSIDYLKGHFRPVNVP